MEGKQILGESIVSRPCHAPPHKYPAPFPKKSSTRKCSTTQRQNQIKSMLCNVSRGLLGKGSQVRGGGGCWRAGGWGGVGWGWGMSDGASRAVKYRILLCFLGFTELPEGKKTFKSVFYRASGGKTSLFRVLYRASGGEAFF